MKIVLSLFSFLFFLASCQNEKSLSDIQAKKIIRQYLSKTELGEKSKIDSILILSITSKSDFEILHMELSKLQKDLEWQSKLYSETKETLMSADRQIENINESDSIWTTMIQKTNDEIDSVMNLINISDRQTKKNYAVESVIVSGSNEGIARHQLIYTLNDSLKITNVYFPK